MRTRTYIALDIDATRPIYRHTLLPVISNTGDVIFYSNHDMRNMQAVIEDLAECIRHTDDDNSDIFERSYRERDPEEWIELDGDAICNFWRQEYTCCEVSSTELLDVAFRDEFMQPFIMGEDTFFRYEIHGETYYTIWRDVAEREADYPEDVEEETGFLAYLSAPGYMDRTEPALYPTYRDAAQALLEMHD